MTGDKSERWYHMSRTNYIFVDFENVQETDLARLEDKPVRVTFVLGERHKNLPVKFVRQLLKHAGKVDLVETGRTGKNALDLVLSASIGAARQTDPAGYFHIISRDKGFDALIGHLNDEDTLAARHEAFSQIPVLMNAAERVKLLASNFKTNPANRPKTRKTLESQMQAKFGKTLSPVEVEETVQGLIGVKAITISDTGDVSHKS